MSRSDAWVVVTLLCSMLFAFGSHMRSTIGRRMAFAGGVVALAAVELYGLWPGLCTIVALVVLPCSILFLIGIVRPQLMIRPWVRIYGTVATLLSLGAVAYQAGWVASLNR